MNALKSSFTLPDSVRDLTRGSDKDPTSFLERPLKLAKAEGSLPIRIELPDDPTVEIEKPVNGAWHNPGTHVAVAFMTQADDNAPIDRLYWYRDGWDGCRAERLSRTVIRHARTAWELAKETTPNDMPRVKPHPDAYVTFSWSDHYPKKELQLSIYDEKKLSCRWVLRGEIGKSSGKCENTDSLKQVLQTYNAYSDDGKQE